jgi:long-chain acyl-CoA synthetase
MSMDSRETLAELPFYGAERFADRPAQRFMRDGAWHDRSYAGMRDIVTEVALGLIALGVRPQDRVCVLSDTRPEWVHVELGIAAAGAIVVPIYSTSSAEECEWVIGDSGAVAVVFENAMQVAKVEPSRDRLPELRYSIVIDPTGTDVLSLDELRAQGRGGDPLEVARRTADVRPDDPALIVYTSGTTGRPKGCVLSHRNMTACCRVTEELHILGPDDVSYIFLPLAHVFAQVVQLSTSATGGVVAYCSGDATAIVPDLAQVRPTCMPSVPRIFEKVYALFAAQVPAETLGTAVDVGLAMSRLEPGDPVPEQLRQAYDNLDAELFAKVRAVFGGRMREAITGAAPIAPEILEFFHAAGVPVYEGYGLTESASTGTLNTKEALKIGTVGRPVPGCEVRIADDGEILMSGPQIFVEYWRNPEATAETLVDGWLQTGDLGSVDADGFVTITGRKKDIIITAGGKNLTPANLENELRQSPWISQAVMYGDRRPYPVALITLDAEQIVAWARGQGLPEDIPSLAAHPSVIALVGSIVEEANAGHGKVAKIKKFAILDHDLTQEDGVLTPTLKVKRRVVHERYADVFDALYNESR